MGSKDTRRIRKQATSRVEDVYRRLTELVQSKGYLSMEEARDLLRSLDTVPEFEQIGDYRLIELLGEGATASVYRAVHTGSRRIVSLKVLSRASLNDPELHKHFVREAKAVMLLQHPNIVRGLEIGDTRDNCYIALEYVDGRTLRDLVTMMGALGELESRHIVHQIAYALEYTHRCDMVHRDIKPENILIDDNTLDAKLFDMGMLRDRTDPDIATIIEAPVHPRYSSPEILTGHSNVDVRSDLYSLGLCFFYMLTGEHAFTTPRNPREVEADREELERHLRSVSPAISGQTIAAVLQLIEFDQAMRPASPLDLLETLGEAGGYPGAPWRLDVELG